MLHATNLGFRELDKSHAVYMVTLTVPHNAGHGLESLRRAVTKAYQRAHSGRKVSELRSRFGVQQSLRRLETTHGSNGWHPHLHALLFCKRALDPQEIESLREWYFVHWGKELACLGFDRPRKSCIAITLAKKDGEYLAKMGVLELAGEFNKGGRCTYCGDKQQSEWREGRRRCCTCGHEINRSPWQILADFTAHRTERDKRLWLAYYDGILGARRLTWGRWNGSIDLRSKFPVEKQKAPQIKASFDINLDRKQWSALSRIKRTELLDAHETGDPWAIRAVLGPDWSTPRPTVEFDPTDPKPTDPDEQHVTDRSELLMAGIQPRRKRSRDYVWNPPPVTVSS